MNAKYDRFIDRTSLWLPTVQPKRRFHQKREERYKTCNFLLPDITSEAMGEVVKTVISVLTTIQICYCSSSMAKLEAWILVLA